ncbi:MAG TPA: hypothetical protein P5250_07400, partial [Bacteroidales bacterium]|nr:hypothetical protein [Bacteroidales bacterium]
MKNINLFLILFSFAILSFSQSNNEGVAINTSGALNDPSSMLDISSTSKGILIPRMTEAQKLSINNPATGLLIYQTDNNEGFWYYDGSKWTSILNSQVITGLLPQGVTGQTLRHDGTNWVNNSFLYNAGNSIGIGTNSPDMSSILDIISYDKG